MSLAIWRAIEDGRTSADHGRDGGATVDSAIDDYEGWCAENNLAPVYDDDTIKCLGERAAVLSLWDEIPKMDYDDRLAWVERTYPYHGAPIDPGIAIDAAEYAMEER